MHRNGRHGIGKILCHISRWWLQDRLQQGQTIYTRHALQRRLHRGRGRLLKVGHGLHRSTGLHRWWWRCHHHGTCVVVAQTIGGGGGGKVVEHCRCRRAGTIHSLSRGASRGSRKALRLQQCLCGDNCGCLLLLLDRFPLRSTNSGIETCGHIGRDRRHRFGFAFHTTSGSRILGLFLRLYQQTCEFFVLLLEGIVGSRKEDNGTL